MPSWLQDGKHAIHEALEDAFHKTEESSKSELREHDGRNGGLLRDVRQLQNHTANAAQLPQSQKPTGAMSTERRLPLGELSPNKPVASRTAKPPARPDAEAVDYETEYKKLYAKYCILEKSRDKYKSVLRQRTEEIDKWAEASDKQKAIIERLRKRLAQYRARGISEIQADIAGVGTPTDDDRLDVAVNEPNRPSPNSSFECPIGAAPDPSAHPPASEHKNKGANSGTETTADEGDLACEASTRDYGPITEPIELPKPPEQRDHSPTVAVKVELSSDGPVFVSERPAHKRKRDRDRGNGAKEKQVQRIKSEHSSSGVECTGEANVFVPTESIDFDEDIHVPTPKKPRGPRKVQQYAGADGATSPFYHSFALPALSGTFPTPAKAPRDIQHAARTQAPYEGVARASGSVKISDKQPQSHTGFRLGLGIRHLAEDGEAGTTTVQRRVAKGPLDTLLNSPSVKAPKPNIQPASHRVQGVQPAPEDDYEDVLRRPAPRELYHGEKMSTRETATTPVQRSKGTGATPSKPSLSRERAPKRPSILRDDMPHGRLMEREKVPLRHRPLDTLRPEDFKPNPTYNDGLSYVYDEVVRGREARSALSGCTDLDCCGKTFRSFAKAERSTIGPSVTTRAEDIKLLEDYLGDDAYKLGSMTRDEKEETWLLAKTWEMADKFGRHRQRYSRMPSPPGFWTVEFPNTQERAEEKRQAEEIQKALVNERYREAMRPGGRWLLRDEEGR